MRNTLAKIWGYSCVPIALLCEGLIFGIIFRICTQGGNYFNSLARFSLALLLALIGMFLLRKMPKRTLIVSSAAACVISLAVYSLVIYRMWFAAANNHTLLIVQNILSVFINIPNNIVFPVGSFFDAESSPALTIPFTVIEIIFPMIYAFSGVFTRTTALFRKNVDK